MPLLECNMNDIDKNAQTLVTKMRKKVTDRPAANWRNIGDVDWEDLVFYVEKCRAHPNTDNFDTAMRVLTALRHQVLDRT